jgi:hypothetical protein
MAERTELERSWSLYHEVKPNGSESWTLHDEDGEERALYTQQPTVAQLNAWTHGFEAGHRNGLIEGRRQHAQRVGVVLKYLLSGETD